MVEHINAAGIDPALLNEFHIDEVERVINGLRCANLLMNAFHDLWTELSHPIGQVFEGERPGLRVNHDLRGVVEPATAGLRRKREGRILTA